MTWKLCIDPKAEIWFRDRKLSAQQFIALVDEKQEYLLAGLSKTHSGSTIVALKERDDLDTLVTVFACQALNWGILLLASTLSPSEESILIRNSCATLFIDSNGSRTSRPVAPIPSYGETGILYQSSGTTGTPKIIFQSWNHLSINAKIGADLQNLSPISRSLAALSLCHTGGLNVQLFPCLQAGGSVCLSSLRSEDYFRKIIEFMPSHTVLVPNQIDMYAGALSKLAAKTFNLVATGSTPVLRRHWDLLGHLAQKTLSVYGLTEAGPYALVATEYKEPINGTVSFLGHPVGGYEVRVDATTGEIGLRGPTVGVYWGCPVPQDWFLTQDLGVESSDGIYFTGRKNRSFKSFGHIVNPEAIEAVLLDHESVVDVRVTAFEHRSHGAIIHAYIVGSKTLLPSIKAHLRNRLARPLWPRKFTFLDDLPKTLIHKTLSPRSQETQGDVS